MSPMSSDGRALSRRGQGLCRRGRGGLGRGTLGGDPPRPAAPGPSASWFQTQRERTGKLLCGVDGPQLGSSGQEGRSALAEPGQDTETPGGCRGRGCRGTQAGVPDVVDAGSAPGRPVTGASAPPHFPALRRLLAPACLQGRPSLPAKTSQNLQEKRSSSAKPTSPREAWGVGDGALGRWAHPSLRGAGTETMGL